MCAAVSAHCGALLPVDHRRRAALGDDAAPGVAAPAARSAKATTPTANSTRSPVGPATASNAETAHPDRHPSFVLSLELDPARVETRLALAGYLDRRAKAEPADAPALRAAKFVTVAMLGMAVSSLSIMLLLSFGIDVRIAKAVSMVVVFGMQFLANALWTFR